jgi:hypothetical protein
MPVAPLSSFFRSLRILINSSIVSSIALNSRSKMPELYSIIFGIMECDLTLLSKMKEKLTRNLFLTSTALGIYVTLCGVFVSVSPRVESLLSRNSAPSKKADIADIVGILTSVAGATGALIGRYRAGGVYTPDIMPGADRVPTMPIDPETMKDISGLLPPDNDDNIKS